MGAPNGILDASPTEARHAIDASIEYVNKQAHRLRESVDEVESTGVPTLMIIPGGDMLRVVPEGYPR